MSRATDWRLLLILHENQQCIHRQMEVGRVKKVVHSGRSAISIFIQGSHQMSLFQMQLHKLPVLLAGEERGLLIKRN
ncbi:hypothetical protein Gohar_007333 [Gossypium harknessii]|uniref:Uncharacterized protein n=1 Tax=Gossypium harknessii TaxID=34285 RepID=A0A7J9GG73_9ROSI|nr:hypothetical protein [Gossypium harknessii]